jgi:hypothetical protein
MTMLEIACDGGPEARDHPAKISVTVKVGYGEERVVEIDVGQPAGSILVVIAGERSCAVEELLLFRDGENDAIPGGTVIGHDYPPSSSPSRSPYARRRGHRPLPGGQPSS